MLECTCHSSFGLKTKDSWQTKLICFFFVFFNLDNPKTLQADSMSREGDCDIFYLHDQNP